MKRYRRILKSEEFQQIIHHKRFFTSPSLCLYSAPRKGENSRIGITVGKKICCAVVRNKCKRQLRMMAVDIIPYEDNGDYIILARANYFNYSYEENKKQLENLFKKFKIRKEKKEKQNEIQ